MRLSEFYKKHNYVPFWRTWYFWFLMFLTVPLPAKAEPQEYQVDTRQSRIAFVSDTPIERIHGKNTQVAGSISVDPNNPQTARGQLTVDSSKFDTGLNIRDEYMRGPDWFDAGKYPEMKFVLFKVQGMPLTEEDKPTDVDLVGQIVIRGVAKTIIQKGKVQYYQWPGGSSTMVVRTRFDVKPQDFKFKIPKVFQRQVSENISIYVDVTLSKFMSGVKLKWLGEPFESKLTIQEI